MSNPDKITAADASALTANTNKLAFSPFEISLLINAMIQSKKDIPEKCSEDCRFIMELLTSTHDENCSLWTDNGAWVAVADAGRTYLEELS